MSAHSPNIHTYDAGLNFGMEARDSTRDVARLLLHGIGDVALKVCNLLFSQGPDENNIHVRRDDIGY